MLSDILHDGLGQKVTGICSHLLRGIGCVNKQSLKIFISEEAKHQSFPGRLWCPQAQEKCMCQNQKPSPCWFFLLFWHQLPRSCKINLTGSSDHKCLEIKTWARLSESFNETELCVFFSFPSYKERGLYQITCLFKDLWVGPWIFARIYERPRWASLWCRNRAGETAQRSRAFTLLQKTQVQVLPLRLSSTIVCNCSSRKSDASFWPAQAAGVYVVHVCTFRQTTQAHEVKVNKVYKQKEWGCRDSEMDQ